MRRNCLHILLTTTLILSAAANAAAQDDKPNRKEMVEQSFDPEAFHHNARFLVTTATGFLILDPVCDPDEVGPLGPDDRCIVLLPAPAVTFFDVKDIGRITLPGNSTKNLILPIGIHTFNYRFHNTTGVPQPNARFRYVPYLTVESDALKDPSLIDPTTGLPFNGKLEVGLGGGRLLAKSLAVDEQMREQLSYSRVGISGLGKPLFMSAFALPEEVVSRMFRGPITFRLNIRGSVRHASDGFMFYGFRLMGN